MRRTCLGALALLVLGVGAAGAQETIDNPEYTAWKKFKKGTAVTLKTTSSAMGFTSEMLMTMAVVDVGDDKIVVETSGVTKTMGMEFKIPAAKRDLPKTIQIPKGVKKPDPKVDPKDVKKPEGTYEEGTETIKVAATEVKTKWYKYRAEMDGLKTNSQIWISEDVPGGIVKMQATTSGTVASETKMELIEFKKP
jgi:hypothetical protein